MAFRELSYDETNRNLEVVGTTPRSRINDRSDSIGELETTSLLELRNRAERVAADYLRSALKTVSLDISAITLKVLPVRSRLVQPRCIGTISCRVTARRGRREHRQIDCLSDLGEALGNERETLWTMLNGYAP